MLEDTLTYTHAHEQHNSNKEGGGGGKISFMFTGTLFPSYQTFFFFLNSPLPLPSFHAPSRFIATL